MDSVSADDEIESLALAIEQERFDLLHDTYRRRDRPTPELVWRPKVSDLPHVELQFLIHYWDYLRGHAALPRYSQIDPLDMQEALGFLMLLEVLDGGADYRYRLYGSKVADRSGIDMTGRRLSDFEIEPLTKRFFIAGYRAVIRRREPLATVHAHAPKIAISSTMRLILPLADETDAISRLLVGNIPGSWRPPT